VAERPWHEVPDIVRCPACFGALPPDTEAACEYCGVGTPPGLTVLQPLAPTSAAWWPNLPPEPPGPVHVAVTTAMSDPTADVFERDAAALRGDWARVGALWSTALTSTVAGPLPDIEDWDHGDVVITLKRLPWWRRIWRRARG